MKKHLALALTLLMICSFEGWSQKNSSKEPPLIDRELFFDNPEIAGGQLSPDGSMISFMKVHKGKMNIWVKKFDEPFEKAKPITADTLRPIPGYFWTYDSKYVLYVQDKGGNENYNVYAVDPAAVADQKTGVPAARNLTPLENVRAFIYNVSKKNPDLIWVGLNNRDQSWHDLFKLEISTGKLTLVRENKDRLTGYNFDWDENLRLATRSAEDGTTEILRADESGFTKIYDCGVVESCGPAGGFDKNNKEFYLVSNKGNEDLQKLYLMDPQSNKISLVEGDPLNKVDIEDVSFSDKSRELILTTYTDARTRYYFKDKKLEADYNFVKSKFPGKEVSFASSTKDENKFLFAITSDVDPGTVYYFDRTNKKLIKQYTPRPALQTKPLAKMDPITFKSSDGLEIPGYIVLPVGKEPKNLPAIVFPHGGPWARDNWGYNSFAQFLANRGYAVLLINFRGSTGYGKKFLNAGNKEWGQKMQDDITWGVKYMVEKGIADPKRVGIMGGSYGGYATLAGLAFTPDVYAAGVDIVGPSNLVTLLNSIPPYWEAGRKIFHERMGDPSTPQGKALLEKQSPLFSASKIKAPLLVVQGQNDPRVKKAESDQIVVALRDLGIAVEYMNAPDEGHGYRDPVNNMAMLAYAEKFLAKHLGGRYQETMKPEVAKKQAELLVDIKTVKLAAQGDSQIQSLKPTSDLKEGVTKFKATIAAGAQNMELAVVREVKLVNGKWNVTETMTTPMGDMTDENVMEKGTLLPLERKVKQGPANIQLTYKPGVVSGNMNMNGTDRPINVKTESPLIADGAGMDLVIARLPLKQNARTTLATFDVMTGQVKKISVELLGTEKVTVPLGTFEATKIAVDGVDTAERSIIWFNSADLTTLRVEATLPQMGNAKFVMERNQ